jgi:subtilisin family serine protease
MPWTRSTSKRLILRCLAFWFVASISLTTHATSASEVDIIVGYKKGSTQDSITSIETKYQLTRVKFITHLNCGFYSVAKSSEEVSALLGNLQKLELVRYAERNAERHTSADPDFVNQYYLSNTGQLVNGRVGTVGLDINWISAKNRFTPLRGVVVAVLDSGVAFDHPDFFDQVNDVTNLWINSNEDANYDGIDTDNNGYVDDTIGWDFFDDDNNPLDENGHGTLVAGIIGALENDEGISGVSNWVYILPVRIGDDLGNITADALISGSTYAANRGARILNCSFGGPIYSQAEQDQVNWLQDQGILIVCAAGNGGSDKIGDNNDSAPTYPSSYVGSNLISVASIDENGNLSPFSNYGISSVDVAAPGENIYGPGLDRSYYYYEDFEGTAPGWLTGSYSGNQSSLSWSLYTPLFGTDTYLADSINSFGFDTDYENYTNTYAQSPLYDLAGIQGPQLQFFIDYELEWSQTGLFPYDYLDIQISSDGISYDSLGYVWAKSSEWETIQIDLSPWENETINIRFNLVSDYSVTRTGVFIDDVAITGVDVFNYDGTQFQYNSGTSFACPLVAGVAALVWSQNPDLSPAQVKSILLDSAASLPSLSGKVASGGMVDADAALIAADEFSKGYYAKVTTDYTELENEDPEGDYDNDGKSNYEEIAFLEDPTSASNSNGFPRIAITSSDKSVSFNRLNKPPGFEYEYWFSSDLNTWNEGIEDTDYTYSDTPQGDEIRSTLTLLGDQDSRFVEVRLKEIP